MADTKLLLTLDAYAKQLDAHLVTLREKRQSLDLAWGRLRDIYEGEAAQAFIEAFETATARLTEYDERSADVSRKLKAKIDQLREVETP
jgi:uncharacterized protein YukE